MTKGKKAWLRIAEAFIAVILIAIVLIILYSKTIDRPERAEEIIKLQQLILDEISDNPELRNAVLTNDFGKVESGGVFDFVRARVPYGFDFEVKICEIQLICEMQEYKEEVYSSERIITATLQYYNPKKIKIFMWRE